MSDLYFVQVESIQGSRVDLRVKISHPDAEPFLEDATFALLLLADSLLFLSDAKAARAPLTKLLPAGRGRAAAATVARVIESVRVRDVANLPEDLGEMSDWTDKRWRKRDTLPAATYEIRVKDAALVSHLAVGSQWDSSAYSSEHVSDDADGEAAEHDESDPEKSEQDPEPLVLNKKNVLVITPKELFGADLPPLLKKMKVDPKWGDVPFIFLAVEKLMDLFVKAHPSPPMSKIDAKEVSKVQVAITDRLQPMVGTALVENVEFFATHFTISADEARQFYSSRGIESLKLR